MSRFAEVSNEGLITLLKYYEQDARYQGYQCEFESLKDDYFSLADLLDEVSYRLSPSNDWVEE